MKEFNEGFEIIAAETYSTGPWSKANRVVLGRHETRFGPQFVTWESTTAPAGKIDYFWGHYFDREEQARADYHRRLAEKYFPSDEG